MDNPGTRRRVAIIAGVRTPFAKAGSDLRHLSAIELGKIAVSELVHRSGVDPATIDLLVFGTVVPNVLAPNIAREVSLMPLFPKNIESWSVSRACASANQAITDAADQITLGHAERRVIAGGAEVALERSYLALARFFRRAGRGKQGENARPAVRGALEDPPARSHSDHASHQRSRAPARRWVSRRKRWRS